MPDHIHPLQAMIDGMNSAAQRVRTETQLTLGGMIEHLSSIPGDSMVDAFGDPHSYRGYYCDLAFEMRDDKITATEALGICQGCMGKVFGGYEGGDYMMGEATPVWIAKYGSCGQRIMAIAADGEIETAPDSE